MIDPKKAIQLKHAAQRKRAYAPDYDPIREDCDLGEARLMDRQAIALLTPAKPLQVGAGGEIVPPMSLGLPGLENALQRPNMLSVPSSTSRSMEARRRLLGISGGAMAILNKTPRPRGRPIIHGRETKTARAQRREVREILRALKQPIRLTEDLGGEHG